MDIATSINELTIEQVVEETVQPNAEKESFISTVSNYVSDFQNWLWLLGICLIFLFIIIYLFSNKRRINVLSKNKLQEFIQNKKYIPLLFVELSNAKELLRYFIYGHKWRKKVIIDFNRLYRGKRLFKNYSKQYIKRYKLSFFSSIKTIEKLINRHLSYFSSHEYLKENPSYFPDYKYTLDINSFWYQEALKYEKQKCEIMNSNFVLVKGTAGNGKTNLVCNIVELLLKLKKRVIFINARDVEESFRDYLISCLNFYFPIKKVSNYLFSLFFLFFKTYIVIDAINENDSAEFSKNIFLELDKLAAKNVKIIVTCRQEYFEQRFATYIENMIHKPYIIELNDYMEQPAQEKLLERYCQNYNVVKPLDFIANLLFSTSLLLLRLYFEVNEGKENQDISLYRFKIYREYILNLSKKYPTENVENFIDLIAKMMIEKQSYNAIAISDITSDNTKINFLRSMSDDNLLTGRKIVKNENTIAETNVEVVYFPFDELRDYCLARYLVINFLDTTKTKNEEVAKKDLYVFLTNLKQGYLSPLEGILHYIYLHFKAERRKDICKDLLNQGFYSALWNQGRDKLFNSFAISVIMDTDDEINDFELEYMASILLTENRDINNLFFYLFYQERNGIANRLKLLLKIIYSYTNYSDLEKVLGVYNTYRSSRFHYSKNEHLGGCLKTLLYSLENSKCIDCQEYFAIIGIVIDDMYALQSFVELSPIYSKVLHNIIQNSKCDELRGKAQSILDADIIHPYKKEVLIKELKEEVLSYERN